MDYTAENKLKAELYDFTKDNKLCRNITGKTSWNIRRKRWWRKSKSEWKKRK